MSCFWLPDLKNCSFTAHYQCHMTPSLTGLAHSTPQFGCSLLNALKLTEPFQSLWMISRFPLHLLKTPRISKEMTSSSAPPRQARGICPYLPFTGPITGLGWHSLFVSVLIKLFFPFYGNSCEAPKSPVNQKPKQRRKFLSQKMIIFNIELATLFFFLFVIQKQFWQQILSQAQCLLQASISFY